MIHRALSVPSLALLTPLIAAPGVADDRVPVRLTQFTVRERVVIRIPRMDARAVPMRTPRVWRETKAPRCIPAGGIVGAAIAGDDIDLVMIGGRRLRAKLDDCPTLDFYTGYYAKRRPDGMICARRDALRSRSGARCEIARFRTLVPRR